MCLQTVLEYPSICSIKGRSDLHALFLYALEYRVRYKVNGFPTILAEVKPNTIVQYASIQVSTAQLLFHWVAYCFRKPLLMHYNVSADRPRVS